MLPTIFQVNWPFDSGEEAKKSNLDGGGGVYLGITIIMILAILITPMPSTKLQVNEPSASGEEVKSIFSRWWPS